MNTPRFFAELKRRNVYKVAAAYAVVGWLIVQIATQVFPFLEIPNWVVRFVIALVAIGFPIALVLAWAFETTPEGIKRTEDVDVNAAARAPKKHAWIYVVVISAAISVGLFFLGRYSAQAPRSASDDLRRDRQTEPVSAKSIAVLPFDNLSEDKANAYFAEGIQDEILTRLAKITELKVIGRASTQRFKSGTEDLAQVAKQLGVAHLLEGSVQKAGDRVRINVQLINATTAAHLWADTFDRSITDVFAVETEVAKTIAEKLAAKLTGAEERAIALRPTDNPLAYELYLKGRYFWNKRTGHDLKRAAEYFTQATTADPGYALAYAGLADVYVLMPYFAAGSPEEFYPKTKAAADKALELDPTLGAAHASLAMALAIYELDFSQATAHFERAIELNPNYATAHPWYGLHCLLALGRFEDAIAAIKRAEKIDPLSPVILTTLGIAYYLAHRYDQAIDQLQKTLEIEPNFYYAHWQLGQALEASGSRDAAIAEYKKARQLNEDPFVLALLGHIYALTGEKAQAVELMEQLRRLAKDRYVRPYGFALLHLGLGEKTEAFRVLEENYRGGEMVPRIRFDPMLDPLRGETRFEVLTKIVLAKAPKQP